MWPTGAVEASPALDYDAGFGGPFRSKPGASPITWPDPALLRLPGRDFQTLLPPDPLHPLVVDHPARGAAQEGCHLPVAQPAMLLDEYNQVIRQLFLVPRGSVVSLA